MDFIKKLLHKDEKPDIEKIQNDLDRITAELLKQNAELLKQAGY